MLNTINFVRAFIVTALLTSTLVTINTYADTEPAVDKSLLAALDQSFDTIQKKQLEIKNLGLRADTASGVTKQALELRRDKSQLELMEQNLAYVSAVADKIDALAV
ncbi:MAG: hypothetical protein ACJAYB_003575, partial [Psychromonas sp.]